MATWRGEGKITSYIERKRKTISHIFLFFLKKKREKKKRERENGGHSARREELEE